MRLFFFLILVVLSCASRAQAPEILDRAVQAYLNEGMESFIPTLTEGSAMEGDRAILGVGPMLGQIEAVFGELESYDFLVTCEFTNRINTSYFVLNYESGPVFGILYTYEKKDGEVVASNTEFHTKPQEILPYFPIPTGDICGED